LVCPRGVETPAARVRCGGDGLYSPNKLIVLCLFFLAVLAASLLLVAGSGCEGIERGLTLRQVVGGGGSAPSLAGVRAAMWVSSLLCLCVFSSSSNRGGMGLGGIRLTRADSSLILCASYPWPTPGVVVLVSLLSASRGGEGEGGGLAAAAWARKV